jgi:peptidoglycan/LPS O-acetylase OafA/YrhL
MAADVKNRMVEPGGALNSLAAVRIIPALCIFLAHVTQYNLFSDPASQSVSSGVFNKVGYEAVSFFVVLSGFIITWVALRQGVGRVFVSRRFLKIFPTHVATWLICLVALSSTAWWPALANLSLIHGWFEDPSVFFSVNIPAWTLCVELLFYSVFPFVFRSLTRLRDGTLVTLLVGLAAMVVLLPIILGLFPDGKLFTEPAFTEGGHQVMVSEWKFWLVYVFPVTRTVESIIGMLVCLLVARGRWPSRNVVAPLALLLAACTAATLWSPFLFATSGATIVPIILLVGCAATADVRQTRSLLRIQPFARLAGYTFNFYLAQWVIITVWKDDGLPRHGYGLVTGVLVFLGLLALAMTFAYVLHNVIEVPVTRAVMKRLKAKWGSDTVTTDAFGVLPVPRLHDTGQHDGPGAEQEAAAAAADVEPVPVA